MALNYIFVAFFLIALVVAAIKLIFLGDTQVFTDMVNATLGTTAFGALANGSSYAVAGTYSAAASTFTVGGTLTTGNDTLIVSATGTNFDNDLVVLTNVAAGTIAAVNIV